MIFLEFAKKVATAAVLMTLDDSTPPAEGDARRLNAERFILASHRCCRRVPARPVNLTRSRLLRAFLCRI